MIAQKRHYVLFACALMALALTTAYANAATCRAIDGDTLICGRQKVRLANVYAAELSEPGGSAAKERLATLVRGANVSVFPVARDKYGRMVANVAVGDRMITQPDVGPRAGVGAGYVVWRNPIHTTTALTSIQRTPIRTTKSYRAKAPSRAAPYGRASKSRSSTYVRPHFRRDGRYVSGHRRRG